MTDERKALEPTQADREAANKLLIGQKVGGGDGQTYVLRTPGHVETVQAFAAHRQATEQAIIAWLNDMKREDTNWPQVIARMIEEGEHHAG